MAIAQAQIVERADTCDAITLEIISGALRSAMSEMGSVVERTAMSPFIREKKDYEVAAFDPQGQLVRTSGFGAPTRILDPVVAIYSPATMEPGDIYWYNDCYASGGAVSHSPDQVFLRPVFFEGRIVAFVESWAHFNDIGGMRPGTLSPDCTEIFQEGTIVPPVRLARGDVLNDELLRLFARNSRFPEMVRGDVQALLAGVRLGERRMVEIFQRFGAERMADAFRQLIERTGNEVIARARETIPVGEYSFTEYIDGDGHGSGPIPIALTLKVADNRITVDATQCGDQTKGPLNWLLAPGMLQSMVARRLLAGDPKFPVNEGIVRVVDEVVLREGSILQPRFPAALGLRSVTSARVIAAWTGLLANATEGNVSASNCAPVIAYLRGAKEDGGPFLISDALGIGYGARPYADGLDAIYLAAQENYPAEFIEANYPLRVRRYALAPDSCGAGRWRGGCGIVREFELLAPEAMLSIRMDSIEFPPWGVRGGKSGSRGSCTINPGTAEERIVPPFSDGTVIKRGEIVQFITGGGGGWGHPYDREPERVLQDVLGGFIGRESALEDYGVVLSGNTIDQAATERQRADRYPTKLFHRGEYVDHIQ